DSPRPEEERLVLLRSSRQPLYPFSPTLPEELARRRHTRAALLGEHPPHRPRDERGCAIAGPDLTQKVPRMFELEAVRRLSERGDAERRRSPSAADRDTR